MVTLERFASFDDALRIVNASDYGLQAGVFTNDLRHTLRAWDELEVGGVVVGDVPSFRVDNMPYGGVKGSGFRTRRRAVGDGRHDRGAALAPARHLSGSSSYGFRGASSSMRWRRTSPAAW